MNPGAAPSGELVIEGRLAGASNLTLRCSDESGVRWVYKPIAGERPLRDFPEGTLAGREVAAYVLSEYLGWGIVPTTVLGDGPFGVGMVQRWVEHADPASGDVPPLAVLVPPEAIPSGMLGAVEGLDEFGDPVVLAHADHPTLRRIAVFDAVINNADRKAGHLVTAPDGRVFGVDHGLCMHADDKLRTVLWGWAGEPLTDVERVTLELLLADTAGADGGPLGVRLRQATAGDPGSPAGTRELAALRRRVDRLLADGVLPVATGPMRIPWPPF